ncbi:PhoX family protein [Aliikangiella sp. IMCC44653]
MPTSKAPVTSFNQLLENHLSRRQLLKAGAAMGTVGLASSCSTAAFSDHANQVAAFKSVFKEVAQGLDENLNVAEDYQAQVLLRWGDPIFEHAPAFDPNNQSEQSQLKQFGFNNDYIGFVPLPLGSNNSEHGILVVNHEYTDATAMFADVTSDLELSLAQTKVDIAAHGLSVVEVKRHKEEWQVVLNSKYNRRITPHTPMRLVGPAAGSNRLKTKLSEDGIHTLGTYANCAGGLTPWGTVLTAEENIDDCFGGYSDSLAEAENYRRFGLAKKPIKSWYKHFSRWDLRQNPNEALHMGWIVEIDPFDPSSVPVKHTALGRFKHEGCNLHINYDGRVVAYSGDDQKFEYIYRFVSEDKYRPQQTLEARRANRQLLSKGTLSVARFSDNDELRWLPLVYGEGPLNVKNGFKSQADVVLDCRKAADLVGATPMDRPEDIEVNPSNGKVYAMLTKNSSRQPEGTNQANPRSNNRAGHILELSPPQGDHCAEIFSWNIFILAGDPTKNVTFYHPETTNNGWFACPDNCTFDTQGNLWVATDSKNAFGIADGLWRVGTANGVQGLSQRFLSAPIGAEVCGPCFTPDNTSLFCSIQHPSEGDQYANPATRWPDFDRRMPPRPSVVVVTHKQAKPIAQS